MLAKVGIWTRLLSEVRQTVSAVTSTWISLRENLRAGRGEPILQATQQQVVERLTTLLQNVSGYESTALAADAESYMVRRLSAETELANRNNLTRTAAYLRIYEAHPELHWALLAHFVSRNGGWNMTDLCGDLIRPTLSETDGQRFFAFLERCNFLIFQDAFPQLLLYQESVRAGMPLFHILPKFGVSVFMRASWETYWQAKEPRLLVTAQIINEQFYIEKRVVQNAEYSALFVHPVFSAQSLFHLVSVVFPALAPSGRLTGVYGNRVRDFTSLTERIAVGKSLYALLFAGKRKPERGFLRFALTIEHTGSRADYLPALFARTVGKLGSASPARMFSPTLTSVWPDAKPDSVQLGDWCQDLQATAWLWPDPPPSSANLTETYIRHLGWLKEAATALGPILKGTAQRRRKIKS